MAFDSFTGSLQTNITYNAGKNGPTSSINFPQTKNNNTVAITTSYTVGGNAIGAINEQAVNIVTIAASGSATLDLTNLTDVLGFTAIALVRLKEYFFCLLNNSQDSTNGTACTQITIGNAVSNPNPLDFGGATMTKLLTNGDQCSYATASAGGITVSSTVKNVLLTNNDGSHSAAVLYAFGGATT